MFAKQRTPILDVSLEKPGLEHCNRIDGSLTYLVTSLYIPGRAGECTRLFVSDAGTARGITQCTEP